MNSDRSIVTKVGSLVLLTMLGVLVLIDRPSAAPDRGPKAERAATTVVVKARSDGTIECSDLSSGPGPEGTVLYHWDEDGLRTARCRPVHLGGTIGLG